MWLFEGGAHGWKSVQQGPAQLDGTVTITYVDPRRSPNRIVESATSTEDVLSRLYLIESRYIQDLEAPMGVTLWRDPSEMLDIGLGGKRWTLGWCKWVDGFPEQQLHAIGDPDSHGSVPFYMEQWTPMPRRWLIERDKASTAIAHWLDCGMLDPSLQWDGSAI